MFAVLSICPYPRRTGSNVQHIQGEEGIQQSVLQALSLDWAQISLKLQEHLLALKHPVLPCTALKDPTANIYVLDLPWLEMTNLEKEIFTYV